MESLFNTPVQHDSPVLVTQSIKICAPADQVWSALAEINKWSVWQKSVSFVRLREPLCEGVTFYWKASGLAFESRIHTCSKNTLLGWTGTTIGTSAVHNWRLQAEGKTTTVYVEESLSGLLPVMFKRFFRAALQKGVARNLLELKTYCEKGPKHPSYK